MAANAGFPCAATPSCHSAVKPHRRRPPSPSPPGPDPCGMLAANRGFPCAAPPKFPPGGEEHPMVPAFPFDHGCDDIHEMASVPSRSAEHTPELKAPCNLVCRLLLAKK